MCQWDAIGVPVDMGKHLDIPEASVATLGDNKFELFSSDAL